MRVVFRTNLAAYHLFRETNALLGRVFAQLGARSLRRALNLTPRLLSYLANLFFSSALDTRTLLRRFSLRLLFYGFDFGV